PPAEPEASGAEENAPLPSSSEAPVGEEREEPAQAAAAAPAPARTLDVAALHAALAASAKRCYPAAARRFGLTGEVTLDFCLDGSGARRSLSLEGTTGQALLDAAARECVVKGALPLPADAAGSCYAVPVRFNR